jgi:hypothetical protein
MNTNNATSTTSRTAGHGARHVLIVLALALAALLFPLSAPVAQADPPEVTASDNPVLIPDGQTTGETTLTWRLTPFPQLAHLTVMESGTPAPVLDLPVSSPPGEGLVKLPVTYGKTYTAQLKDLAYQPLGAPLTITTERPPERPDIKIDFGCVAQCINDPDVEPHGGWAQFTINTTEKAVMTLEASKTKPNANGTWSNPNDVAASNATILPTQNWTPPLPNLDSNTTYYYVVRAHDGNGHEQVKTGSFKTLTRRVDVTFAEIEMIDDSDDFGDCECYFEFGAGNETKQYGTKGNPKSIASGTTVHPNVTFTINNSPSEIPNHAVGNDDDEWDTFYTPTEVSVSRQGPPAAPGAVDEQFTESFTISGTTLEYKARGTYKVTYVP